MQQVDSSLLDNIDGSNKPSKALMGTLQQTIECLQIPYIKHTDNTFATIALDIPSRGYMDDNEACSNNEQSDKNSIEANIDIHNCLQQTLLQPTYLTGENQLRIESDTNEAAAGSQHYHDAMIYYHIKPKLPSGLYLHFNRFRYNLAEGRLKKVSYFFVISFRLRVHVLLSSGFNPS